MKPIGIVRKIDKLGRIIIPRELIKMHKIKLNETEMNIDVEEDSIILTKYKPRCVFCGESTDNTYKGKNICENCKHELSDI